MLDQLISGKLPSISYCRVGLGGAFSLFGSIYAH